MIRVVVVSAWYEIRMSLRARMLRIAAVPLAGFGLLLALGSHRWAASAAGHVADGAVIMNVLGGLGLALAAADRFRCQVGHGLPDLLAATPGSLAARLWGTLTGTVTVTLAPMAVALVVYGFITALSHDAPTAAVTGFAGVALVLIPGGLAVAALAALVGLVMPVILARITAMAVWAWATVENSRFFVVPTTSYTMLSPAGGYPAVAWLGAPRSAAVLTGAPVSGLGAAMNILFVLACAVAFLAAAWIWTERNR